MDELSVFYLLLPTLESHWCSISDARELPSVPPTTQSSNRCDDPSRWVKPLSLLFCEWGSRGTCHDSGRRQSASQPWLLGPLTAHLFCLCYMCFLPAWARCFWTCSWWWFILLHCFPMDSSQGRKLLLRSVLITKQLIMCDNKRLVELKFGDF